MEGMYIGQKWKQEAQWPWRPAWSLARLEEVGFIPNSHVAITYVADATFLCY